MKNNSVPFKKYYRIVEIIIFSLVLFVTVFAPVTHAAGLVPCGRSEDDPTTTDINESEMCRLCHFIIGIKKLIDYGFTIMVVVALAMMIIAGVTYIVSAGSTGMMDTAKHLLKNVIIGFSVILGAWLIVNTALWVLGAKGDLGIGIVNWYTFTCQ